MNLRRNTVFGLLGFAVPTAILLVGYPLLLDRLGAAALGVFLVATTLNGSFAFLEFGLTTVTTKLVAERADHGDAAGAADVVATSGAFYLALGAAGALVLAALAPAVARWTGGAGVPLGERIAVFRLAAVQLVFVYLSAVGVAVFKGLHRFDHATFQISAASALNWIALVAAATAGGGELVPVAAAALAVQAAVAVVTVAAVARACAARGVHLRAGRPRRSTFAAMLRLGSFMSLNGVAGVLMAQVQTLVMARVLTPVAVTVSSTAMQVVSKINAMTNTAFETVLPVSATLSARRTPGELGQLRSIYLKALGLSSVASIGASVVLAWIAPVLVRLWLRSDVNAEIATVIRILCVGFAVNGATPVAYHLLNGIGRPEANTGFMLLGTVIFYGTLLALTPGGLSVERFALSSSVAFVVNGILYFAFCELWVWRRWLVPLAPAPER